MFLDYFWLSSSERKYSISSSSFLSCTFTFIEIKNSSDADTANSASLGALLVSSCQSSSKQPSTPDGIVLCETLPNLSWFDNQISKKEASNLLSPP